MLPMKFAKRWQWENLWLVFSIVSLLIMPWGLALLLAGNLGEIYTGLRPEQLLLPFLLGAGWGVAQVLFGLSIARLGQHWATRSSLDSDPWVARWSRCSSKSRGPRHIEWRADSVGTWRYGGRHRGFSASGRTA